MENITEVTPDLHGKEVTFKFWNKLHLGVIHKDGDRYFLMSKTAKLAGGHPDVLPEGYTERNFWCIAYGENLSIRNFTSLVKNIKLKEEVNVVNLSFPID